MSKIKLILLVAMNHDNAIGRKNKLPWKCPEDLRAFRAITLGHTLVMGRTTYESLPSELDGRKIVVMTNRPIKGVTCINSPEELLAIAGTSEKPVYLVGGASIYEQFLHLCDMAVVHRIDHKGRNCDTFFPMFEFDEHFELNNIMPVEEGRFIQAEYYYNIKLIDEALNYETI